MSDLLSEQISEQADCPAGKPRHLNTLLNPVRMGMAAPRAFKASAGGCR